MNELSLPKAVGLFSLAAAVIVGAWWWLGSPIAMPVSPLGADEKLYCLSYAPFHGTQTPTDLATRISPAQIDQDLSQLAKITGCVRTYSVDFGLDYVPQAAKQHGLKVMLGIWISSRPERNEFQISTGVGLANQFPDTVKAVIVGNETLLRGEISPTALAATLRRVKSAVKQPVTYADVWEFWLRNRELADAVDFITIHILPYWEDIPISAAQAADHVASIRNLAAREFSGREIVVGETGWPSAGRMREGALPSPANQARVIQEILARGKRDSFHVNIIEAYDQPWKRYFEGTVGGHWGLISDSTRAFKFNWGERVSNHPYWPWQAAGGVALAALVFSTGYFARQRSPSAVTQLSPALLIATAAISGIFVGWAVENASVESLGFGGWLRSAALVLVAIAAPIGCAAYNNNSALRFDRILAAPEDRTRDRGELAAGIILIAICLLAIQTALGLVFDPRYRDFPFAALTAAVAPFLLLQTRAGSIVNAATAERIIALVLTLAAIFIAINETLANWQALWLASLFLALGFSLARARAVPS